ncbi:MAG TPA: serine/threonine-protein kinase [Pseudomonadota bacterium]|nr:serine/threonine-protein kinase [Pseudomonadota bacterium]
MSNPTMLWAQSMLGRTLKAHYRLDGILGEGAMGVVFRGINLAMGKAVAIKMMRKETFDTPDAVERFNREARVWSQLNHPVITQVFDFGVEDGQPFLVMELVEGVDLSEVLKSEGTLDALRAVQLMRQLASALEEAHRLGVVHRDIKPQNMKLLRYKPGGKVVLKVLDFGMAKQVNKVDQRLTAPGMLVGTPKYVAPEQVTENPVIDGRADLYAAGIVFYEILTGSAPFVGTPHEVLFAHLGTPPKPLPETVPQMIAEVVMRLLRKRPEERYAHAAALELALEECEMALRAPGAFSSGGYVPVVSPSGMILVPAGSASSGAIPGGGPARGLPGAKSSGQQAALPQGSSDPGPSSLPSSPQHPGAPSVTSQGAIADHSEAELRPPTSPMRSALTGGLFLGLMLLSAVGFYAVRHSLPLQRLLAGWLPPSMYKVPQDEAVTARLRNLEALRDARQWNSVMTGVTELQQQFGATLLPDQLALLMALQGRAAKEQPMHELYERLVAAATRPDADEVLRLHALLSHESVYFGLSQGYYDAALEQYAAAHVAQAEQLRLAGRCNEFLAEMQRLLATVPSSAQARSLDKRECPPAMLIGADGGTAAAALPEATPPAPAAAK